MEISQRQICNDMFLLLRHVKAAMMSISEAYNITPPQIAALYAILHGDTQMGQLAQALHCDASNATGIIDKLVSNGLVVRQESPQDRRVKVLQLTAQGSKAINEIIEKLPAATGCNGLSVQERSQFHDTIAKLAN